MKSPAFTFLETLVALIVASILIAVLLSTMQPNNIRIDALKKSGAGMLYQLDFATKRVMAQSSTNYSMETLKSNATTTFSITASDANSKLMTLYKKYLGAVRNKTASASYTGLVLKDEAGTTVSSTLKVSSFSNGYFLKNGTYFASKTNGNCTTSETYVYNPSMPSTRSASKSCGLFFYDVNGEDNPNRLGVDQYIISFGKFGLK